MEGKWVAEWGPNEFGETEFVYLDHMKVGLMSAVGIRGVIGALHADGHFLCPRGFCRSGLILRRRARTTKWSSFRHRQPRDQVSRTVRAWDRALPLPPRWQGLIGMLCIPRTVLTALRGRLASSIAAFAELLRAVAN